jgi:uncharacterized protein with GYD domain
VVEQLGGKLLGYWACLGAHDIVVLCQLPDHYHAGALRAVTMSAGAISSCELTQLYELEDGVKALELAAESIYQPPA